MKIHYLYILDELIGQAAAQGVPDDINGDASPRFAWRAGYLTALGAVLDAFKEAEKKETIQ